MKRIKSPMESIAKDFWQSYQWLGQESFNVKLQKTKISDWQTSYVKDLFDNANWNGKAELLAFPKTISRKLEIRLTVKDFFQCFSWLGRKDTHTPQVSNVKQNFKHSKKQSQLSELSQLF